jgi:hypothetical protein
MNPILDTREPRSYSPTTFYYTLHLLASIGSGSSGSNAALTVQLHELASIDLGGLQDLDLADEAAAKGIDALALLLNLLANSLGDPAQTRKIPPNTSTMTYSLPTKSFKSELVASRVMASNIFLRMLRI